MAPGCGPGTSRSDTLDGVLLRHPRGPFKRDLVAMIRAEAAAVPGGRFALLDRCGLTIAVRMAPFSS